MTDEIAKLRVCASILEIKLEKAVLREAIKIGKALSKLHDTTSCTFTAATSLYLIVHRWAKHPEYFLHLFSDREVAFLSTLALHGRKGKIMSSEGKKNPRSIFPCWFSESGHKHTHMSTIDYVQLLPHVTVKPSTHLAGTFI